MHLDRPPARSAVRRAVVAAACAALLGLAVAVFVTQTLGADVLGDAAIGRVGWWTLLRPAVLIAAGAALAAALLLVALRARRRPLPSGLSLSLVIVLVPAAALLATTPVAVSYRDGCNYHDDVAPAVAVPYLKAAGPENSRASYFGFMTQMACYPGR